MGTESISLVVTPLDSLAGKTFYHGTVVYTNSAGQQFFVGGDIGNQSLTHDQRSDPKNVAEGQLSVITGSGSPYGLLTVVSGAVDDPSKAAYVAKWINAPGTTAYQGLSGSNLSANWSRILDAYSQIGAAGLQYAPITQNSNSAACTALAAGNVPLMTSDTVPITFQYFGQAWLPGCTTILPTSYTSGNDYSAYLTGFDSNGNYIVGTTERTSTGATLDTVIASDTQNAGVDYSTATASNSSGTNVSVDGSGATFNVAGTTEVTSSGSNVTITGQSGSSITLEGDNLQNARFAGIDINLKIDGFRNQVFFFASGSQLYDYGSDNSVAVDADNVETYNYGYGDVTHNYSNADSTYNYGDHEHNFNNGTNDYGYNASNTDTEYNEYITDTGGGYGIYTYGGYSKRGNGTGIYYYGTGVTSTGQSSSGGINIHALMEFDKAHGNNTGSAQAASAAAQVESAIKNNSMVITSGDKWNHKTVTWSLAQIGGQISGSMGPSEEAAINKAFAEWASATGLTFKEVSSSLHSDIKIGWGDFDTAETNVVGLTALKVRDGVIETAEVRLENPSDDPLVSKSDGNQVYTGTDSTFYQTLLHEIGHAVGFGDNVDPLSIENYSLTQANRTLSSSDIAAAALLYGKTAAHAVVTQASGLHADGLIQAMSSFAPIQMAANTQSANDVSLHTHAGISMPLKYLER